jgi:hypothetical protein
MYALSKGILVAQAYQPVPGAGCALRTNMAIKVNKRAYRGANTPMGTAALPPGQIHSTSKIRHFR